MHRKLPSLFACIETALVFGVFCLEGAWPPPDTNEPHYLGKARHYWDPSWCEHDFFLNSADTHLFFYLTAGWVIRALSFPAAAIVGRGVTYALMAIGWRRLSHAIVPWRGAAVLSAALFVALNYRCHMAGEWVVGGFEAKGIAYALVFFALALAVEGQWNGAWIAGGAASAFHVLVGGWSTLALGLAWWLLGANRPPLRSMLPGLMIGGILALPGVVPGLALTKGAAPQIVAQANELYVYERLPHHLWPAKMQPQLIERFLLLSAVWVALCAFTISDPRQAVIRRMVAAALGFAAAGWVISLAAPLWPVQVAGLLKFYWFRSSDAMVPLGAALIGIAWLRQQAQAGDWRRALPLVAVLVVAGHFVALTRVRWNNPTPRADARGKVVDHAQWCDACAWIQQNTPVDAVFLTPRSCQTFKWYAQRGEVVTWKDVPQDALELVAWWRRMEDVHGKSFGDGPNDRFYNSLSETSVAHLVRVAQKYGAQFVITECELPLALPCLYQNEVYAVYDLQPTRGE
ncbi:MAG TPA: DUF6798 domain-containing protein [Pirellulales bacterium]|nr:DUF6798 domain-containing protein [Pirellulales bacterium]